MIGLLLSPIGKIAAGLAVASMVTGGVYLKGRSDGRQALLLQLAAGRIEIYQDGRKIDDEAFGADDDALCALLGGCMPGGAEGD